MNHDCQVCFKSQKTSNGNNHDQQFIHITSAQWLLVYEDLLTCQKRTKLYANRMDARAPHANYIETNDLKILFVIIFCRSEQKEPSPGGLEPPTFRLTAERANQLRQGDLHEPTFFFIFNCVVPIFHLRKISTTLSHLARKK